jgi:ferredoxin-type protein NapH
MNLDAVKRVISMLRNRRWLLMRRIVQLLVISAFIIDIPEIGRIADGNLSSSVWFGRIPLTDPFILLQSLLAASSIAVQALVGAAVITGFYALFGGRIYCSWVCPINLLTDLAYWLRQRLNVKGNLTLSREHRSVVLILSLVLSALCGTLAWEMVNPITLFQRELMWVSVGGLTILATLFLFDLLVSRRGWCGHLCPVGAFYSWLGRYGRLRVTAHEPSSCSGCSACIRACPEPHVLAPVISQKAPSVTSGDCTRCGACLDSCSTGVLSMKLDLGQGKTFRGIPIVTKD